jgi:holo-[acyl-carrier protein] synthase
VNVPADGSAVVGLGTDLVDVDRLRRALERTPQLAQRLFAPDELDYAHRHRDPAPHLAARFAAKEAVMKALGAGISDVAFTEIVVERAASGAPSLRLAGRAASLARERGVGTWHVSLTHTDAVAGATVVASA